MTTNPDIPPLEFRPADAVAWTVSYPDYPAADGWELRTAFIASDEQIIIPGTTGGQTSTAVDAGGGEWTMTLSTAFTAAAFVLGATTLSKRYRWQEYAQKSAGPTDRVTLRTGYLTVLKNLDSAGVASGLDIRTHAEICLDAIEAVLQNKATKDQFSYSIAGRALSRYSWRELIAMRSHYRAEVRREQLADRRARGLGNSSVVKVRFGGLR